MQKEAVYDAEGNLVESDESEQEATVIAVGGITKGSTKKTKKKKGKQTKEPAADTEGISATETMTPESDLISADAAFVVFRDSSTVAEVPQTDAPVEVVLNKSRGKGPKKRKAEGSEPFWKTAAFKAKKRAGSAMQSLSTRPETEVANADHVSDVYSVRHGKGY
ncbi:hypothetical protein DIPPA_18960 [Diplonema papillatum]|nr:hypothetical protein DIPPA_18960 [Diplonema papillatum]